MNPKDDTSAEQNDAHISILHGEDEVDIKREIQRLMVEMGDDSLSELNLARLDGRQVSLAELANQLNTLPFGDGGRLVVISHALALAKSEAARQELLKLLKHLPASTSLILIIPDSLKYRHGKKVWLAFDKERWFTEWVAKQGKRVELTPFPLPTIHEMPNWIQEEAQYQGGSIEPRAAIELANALGNDTALASQEINKLLTYTAGERAVTSEDVRLLCSPVGREDIFALVDAIATGDAKTALRLLDISIQNQPEVNVFAMIVRHFRQLLVACEMLSEGGNADSVKAEIKVLDFVAIKLVKQARRFSLEKLEQIFQRLNTLDEEMKNGRTPPNLALQLFVAEMARVR